MNPKKNLMNSQSECIFYLLNDKEYKIKKKKDIHKIAIFDFFVRNELTNINKIKKILDYKKYYYVCENSSELKITNLEDDIRDIKSVKEIKSDETVLMKFEDLELIYLKDYLKALSSSTIYIYNLIDFYKSLLKIIVIK